MADELGAIIIKVKPDDAELTAAFKKAGKESGQQHVSKLTDGLRKFAADAAATVGGPKAGTATNFLLTGLGRRGGAAAGVGGKGIVGGGKADIGGKGVAGLAGRFGISGGAAATVGVGIAAAIAAIVLATRALNKNTRASVDRLSSVTPILALEKARDNVNIIRRNIIEGRLFGEQIAANNQRLRQANNEMFRFTLELKAIKIKFQTAASFFAIGAAKLLDFLTVDYVAASFSGVAGIFSGVALLFKSIFQALGLADSIENQDGSERKRGDSQTDLLTKILAEVKKLRDGGDFAGINDMMLAEVRAMAGILPTSSAPTARSAPGSPVAPTGGGSVIERAHRDMQERRRRGG